MEKIPQTTQLFSLIAQSTFFKITAVKNIIIVIS